MIPPLEPQTSASPANPAISRQIGNIETIETIPPSLPYRDNATTFRLNNAVMLDAGLIVVPVCSLKTE